MIRELEAQHKEARRSLRHRQDRVLTWEGRSGIVRIRRQLLRRGVAEKRMRRAARRSAEITDEVRLVEVTRSVKHWHLRA